MNDSEGYWLAAANSGRCRPVATARCICGCGRPGVQKHHAVYAQEIKRLGGSVKDKRNLVPVYWECHGAHHGRSKPFELGVLPDSVFEFAFELMGPAAFDYLRRRYVGEDARLDALLAETV